MFNLVKLYKKVNPFEVIQILKSFMLMKANLFANLFIHALMYGILYSLPII